MLMFKDLRLKEEGEKVDVEFNVFEFRLALPKPFFAKEMLRPRRLQRRTWRYEEKTVSNYMHKPPPLD